MSEELKPDFEVKLQSDAEPTGYNSEPRVISQEVALLRGQVAQLCQAVRGLTTLQAVMDKKLDVALKGGSGSNVGCI